MSVFTNEVILDPSALPLPISAAALPLPAGASTEATLALIKAKTDNIDVLLSTRTKPADTQVISGAVSISNFPATQPISGSVSISNFPATQPVSGPLTDAQLRATPVPISGTVSTTSAASATATIARVATANTSTVLLAANASRKKAIIMTETGAANYLAYAATASLTAYTYLLGSTTVLEVTNYTGVISMIRASGSGNVQVTELV